LASPWRGGRLGILLLEVVMSIGDFPYAAAPVFLDSRAAASNVRASYDS